MSAQPTRPDARTTLLNEAIKICEQVQSDWSTHSVAPLAVGACIERLAALRDAETPTRESAHDLRERMESAVACIDAEKEDRERRLLRAAAENDEVSRMAFRCQIQAFDQAIRFVNDALAAAPAPSARPEMYFSCPSCGDPGATTVEPEVDIHSGAVYRCAACQQPVIFSAQTPDQYSASVMAAAPSAREAERRETHISAEDLEAVYSHQCDQPDCPSCRAWTDLVEKLRTQAFVAGQMDAQKVHGDALFHRLAKKVSALADQTKDEILSRLAAPPVSGAPTPGPRFQRRPQPPIEAEQFWPETNPLPFANRAACCFDKDFGWFVMTTHGQRTRIVDGDWIVPEPDGRGFYPVKPHIFTETYEPLPPAPSVERVTGPTPMASPTAHFDWQDRTPTPPEGKDRA